MDTKSWLTSKTVWLAIAQAVAGILVVVFSIDPNLKMVGGLAIIKSAADVIIRLLTEQPIS